MSCCSQKRLGQVAQSAIRAKSVAQNPDPVSRPVSGTTLRYLGSDELLVRGPRSGRVYRFTADTPVIAVAPADFDALLKTRLFREEAATNVLG
jgi:hypothetical protein